MFESIRSQKKEVVAIDYLGSEKDKDKKPSENEIKKDFGMSAQLVFCIKNNCWSVERRVKGLVFKGVFTPYVGQDVTYTINLK